MLAVGAVGAETVPYLAVDFPHDGGSVGRTFGIQGTALNSDGVHVWGYPLSGPVFLGSAWTSSADIIRQIDQPGGFSLVVRNAPAGYYPVVVYAHNVATNDFPTSLTLTLSVVPCSAAIPFVNWAFMGPSGPVTIQLPYCGV